MAEVSATRRRCERRRTGRTARQAIMNWVQLAVDSERGFLTRCSAVMPSMPVDPLDSSTGHLIARALYAGGWQPQTGCMDWIERAYLSEMHAQEMQSLARDLAQAKTRHDAGEALDVPREVSERDEKPRPRTSATRIQVVLAEQEHARIMQIAEETGQAVSAIAASLIAQALAKR